AASPLVVRRREDAAQRGSDAQHVEKVPAHPQRPRQTYLAALREIEAVCAPCEDARKCLLPISDLLPDRIGYRRMRAVKVSPRAAVMPARCLAPTSRGFLPGKVRSRTASRN